MADDPAPTPAIVPPDLVKLKNGGMLRGTILELTPGTQVIIQTASGEQRKFPMSEVEYAGPASKAPDAPAPKPPPDDKPKPESDKVRPLVTVNAPEAKFRVTSANGEELTLHLRTSDGFATSGQVAVISRGFARICTAPCTATMAAGTYRFALSQGDSQPIELKESTSIKDGDQLVASYTSQKGRRTTWTLLGGSAAAVGTAIWIWGSFKENGCVVQDYPDTSRCKVPDTGDPVWQVIGGAVALGGLVALFYGVSIRDQVSLTVQPGVAGLRGERLLGQGPMVPSTTAPTWQGLSLVGRF